ncbi:BON domain-containing protein [Undibacterium sp. Jales W-56]|nr:BON domain-containing protein [Undibacterium sp. Jales W-56]MCU6434951.1 BON domain-containing protein [Undibacterium sp. Jales W-56]
MIKNLFQKSARPLLAISLCCGAAASLQGCVEMMVGSAVVGTFAATDRRTFGAQTEDKSITLKGEIRMSRTFGDAAHINVSSFNRRALLTGEVADEQTRENAEREMRAIEGVQAVQNELQIAGLSNYSARSSDALITTKVKASFVDTKDLYASAFKVVTEAGTVYLMGRVTQREGNLAGEVARGVSGVRKVVKVFEYISETELKEMQSAPKKQEPAQ